MLRVSVSVGMCMLVFLCGLAPGWGRNRGSLQPRPGGLVREIQCESLEGEDDAFVGRKGLFLL
ncbi:hypothetical protein BDZ45DRAFT_674415 [Acephala macrosclerotiorum]|nr:hypothetical protein BDZ45DRAFT_674415 [Acephala macrosclerotiorum]